MNSINDLTPRAQQALAFARKQVQKLDHSYVGTEHLLLGLIDIGRGAVQIMRELGIDVDALRKRLVESASGINSPVVSGIDATPDMLVGTAPAAKINVATIQPETRRRHYLLFDNSVQWFAAAIVQVLPGHVASGAVDDEVVDFRDVPSCLWNCAFVNNVTAREPAFTNREIRNNSWTGWSLSEAEFKRMNRLLDLRAAKEEYDRLISYP